MASRIPVALSGMVPAETSISAGSHWSIVRPQNFKLTDLNVNKPVLLHCKATPEDKAHDIYIADGVQVVIHDQTYLLSKRLKLNHAGLLCVWI